MAFTKTSNPYWYIDDTPASIAADLKIERIKPEHIVACTASSNSTKMFMIVWRPGMVA